MKKTRWQVLPPKKKKRRRPRESTGIIREQGRENTVLKHFPERLEWADKVAVTKSQKRFFSEPERVFRENGQKAGNINILCIVFLKKVLG
jgi:hypothetical protein